MKVNGKNIELTSVSAKTVTDYLKILRINPGTVAIERNGEILEREKWDKTHLAEEDKIEIIKFVGGG
ncbi:MAG: sulfur carrier protein ThiS [Leptospiraceae bacterium]|nr:sulfur carrier protein ThiS [Leptospiraceae bacterium]